MDTYERPQEFTPETTIVVTFADERRMLALRADIDEAITVTDLLTERPMRVCRVDSGSYLATTHPALRR